MRNDQAEALSVMGGLEILSVPVISTGHLTQAEAQRVPSEWPTDTFESMDGFVVHVPDEEPLMRCVWPGLVPVRAWARKAGYRYVMLVPEGDEVPGLEVYPW